jgi:hypothetical protein
LVVRKNQKLKSPTRDWLNRGIEIFYSSHNGLLEEFSLEMILPSGEKREYGIAVTAKSSLCFSCNYGNHVISGKGSSFLQCQKHFENLRYPKYPVLPVVACSGYKILV